MSAIAIYKELDKINIIMNRNNIDFTEDASIENYQAYYRDLENDMKEVIEISNNLLTILSSRLNPEKSIDPNTSEYMKEDFNERNILVDSNVDGIDRAMEDS